MPDRPFMENKPLQQIVDSIAELPFDWHAAGSMSPRILQRMSELLSTMGPVNFTVETGSGKTTLLFSHASRRHVTFALDGGSGSISQVKKCGLFNAGTVSYEEGPSQIKLPAFHFTEPIDVALIDGPHGYPFPDLEYFHLYPHIREGGYLLLDDIQIPNIDSMFRILKADEMWDLQEVIEDLAIFRRTAQPSVEPTEDGWWKQGFNKAHFDHMQQIREANAAGHDPGSSLGSQVRRMIPKRVKLALKALLRGEEPR